MGAVVVEMEHTSCFSFSAFVRSFVKDLPDFDPDDGNTSDLRVFLQRRLGAISKKTTL
jgi:hypothetical protein